MRDKICAVGSDLPGWNRFNGCFTIDCALDLHTVCSKCFRSSGRSLQQDLEFVEAHRRLKRKNSLTQTYGKMHIADTYAWRIMYLKGWYFVSNPFSIFLFCELNSPLYLRSSIFQKYMCWDCEPPAHSVHLHFFYFTPLIFQPQKWA